MRRDFGRYISTDEDRLTFRKWVRGLAIFYGLVGLFVVSFVAVRNYQTDMSHNTAAATPAARMIAINNSRAH
jgi:hypothetical protein